MTIDDALTKRCPGCNDFIHSCVCDAFTDPMSRVIQDDPSADAIAQAWLQNKMPSALAVLMKYPPHLTAVVFNIIISSVPPERLGGTLNTLTNQLMDLFMKDRDIFLANPHK